MNKSSILSWQRGQEGHSMMSLFPKKFSRGYPTLKARPQEEFNFRESMSLPDPTTGWLEPGEDLPPLSLRSVIAPAPERLLLLFFSAKPPFLGPETDEHMELQFILHFLNVKTEEKRKKLLLPSHEQRVGYVQISVYLVEFLVEVADSTLEVSDSRYARTEPSFLLHWIEFTYAFPSSFHLKVLELIIRSSHIGWLGLRGRQERLETRNYQHCKQKGLELHRGVIELAETNGKGASTHSTQWPGTKLSRIRNSYDLSFGRAKSRSYRKILLTRSCPRSGLIEGPIEKRTPKAALYTRKGLSKGTSQLGNNYRRKDLQRGTEQFAVVKAPTYERSKGDWRILPRAFCALALYPWIRVLVWISWAECLGVKLTIVFKPSRSVNVKEVELPSDREIGDD
ncbi:hypothetical protein DKX38_030055 (mitochondrion) [Salix brachista]|uniref:Uncharacterized protein n=1 Tax=Salix brachista TaxID=2182728 RepID=A0A5N5IZ04_9ROSI|nr:hypothetical protein DKX38_030055 [Salix brachista]